jgi:hypothetical protein
MLRDMQLDVPEIYSIAIVYERISFPYAFFPCIVVNIKRYRRA